MKSLHEVFKSAFARNVLTLVTGTSLAQGIVFVSMPIITRLYSSADLGLLSVFVAITGIISIISCLSYELSIVLPNNDEDACNILGLAIIISMMVSSFSLVLVFLFRYQLAELIGVKELGRWLWLAPPCILGMGTYQAFNYWSTRKKSFKRLAISRMVQSSTSSGVQVVWPMTIKPSPTGLIGGQVIGQLTASLVLGWQIWRDDKNIFKSSLSGKHIKSLAVKYRSFPLYTAPVVLVNTISLQIPAIILAYYFGPVVVGFYGLTYRVLIAPMNLVGTSFGQVFFPKATEEDRLGQLAQITQKVFSKLFLVGFIPMLLFVGAAPDIFTYVFGASWQTSGIYAQILCPWFFFQFISSPLTSIFYIREKQRTFLLWNIVLLCSRIVVISIGGLMKNQMIAIALLGISGALMYGLLIMIIFHLTGGGHVALIPLKKIIIWIPLVVIYFFLISYLSPLYSLILFGTYISTYFICLRPELNRNG
jgi:lipopolysaccharide exporter